MNARNEPAIRRLLDQLTDAWNRGDAAAFGARYRDDGTFTNVFGTFHSGREAFVRRHAEVFAGFLKGTRIAMTIRKLRLVRPEVAIIDLDVAYADFQVWPPGVAPAPDGLHASLLMVLVKDGGDWWIAAYHNNIWRAAAP